MKDKFFSMAFKRKKFKLVNNLISFSHEYPFTHMHLEPTLLLGSSGSIHLVLDLHCQHHRGTKAAHS